MSKEKELAMALLWIIYEQCVFGGKVHAKLLCHGQEAFTALGLKDGCDVRDVERVLFSDD